MLSAALWHRFRRCALALTLSLFAQALLPQEIEALKQGVVRVPSYTEDGKARTGTGFIVKLGADIVHIVTASHVVQGAAKFEVEFFARRDARAPSGDCFQLSRLDVDRRANTLLACYVSHG